jgi:hypothetical protein
MPGTWPLVQFVSAPADDAEVRLDLNAIGAQLASTRVHADGFSLGSPSLDGEPGNRGRVWGGRQLSLPLDVGGSRSAALGLLRRVGREVAREENWLRFQLGPNTDPVWHHTYASRPEPVSLDRVYNDETRDDTWVATLAIDADPFGVGRERTLGPFTTTNHPASGTNPMRVALPPVEGEVPAPAAVRVVKAAAGGMLGPAVAVGGTAPGVVSAPTWGAGVGAAVTAAGWLAGSYRPTGTLADWTTLATWTPAGLPPRRWRTLLRASGSSDVGSLQLRWVVASPGVSSQVVSDPVTVPVVGQLRWVDLGAVPWPLVDGAALGVSAGTTLTLQARRLVPGGDLRLDGTLLMVPAAPGDDLLLMPADNVGTAAVSLLADADARRALMAVGGAPMRPPGVLGGWPYLHPDRTNVLLVGQNVTPTRVPGRNDDPASTTAVTVTYRPRHLWGL